MGRTAAGQVGRLRCQGGRGTISRSEIGRRRRGGRRYRFVFLVFVAEVVGRSAASQAVPPIGQRAKPATVAAQSAVGVVSGGIIIRDHGRTLALVQEPAGVSRAAVFVLRFRFHVGGRSGSQRGRGRWRSVLGALVPVVGARAAMIAGWTGVTTGAGFFAGGLSSISGCRFPGLHTTQQRGTWLFGSVERSCRCDRWGWSGCWLLLFLFFFGGFFFRGALLFATAFGFFLLLWLLSLSLWQESALERLLLRG